MDRLFECVEANFFKMPDGTLVNPFLKPLLDGLSIAAGYIDVGTVSQIHVHPFISQVTVLLAGTRLAELDWNPPELRDPARSRAARERALQRLGRRPA